MNEIDDDDIRRIDGGLLLIFRELLRRRRTTTAASRLGLSQSAVSHALGRLRDLFGDPLFLRRTHGLAPTRRALELAPRIDALIDLMGAALRAEPGFDPAKSGRHFHLAATEYAVGVVDATLIERFRLDAPGATLSLYFARGYLALAAVRRGEADLALGRFDAPPAGLMAEPLFEDRYCVVARVGHPRIRGKITLRAWRENGHVFVSGGGDLPGPSIGEDPIPGDARAIALVPRWEVALPLVAGCDAIATGPRRLAEQLAPALGLQVLEPPLPAPPFTVSMVRRREADAGLEWLCAQVRAAAAGVGPKDEVGESA